MRSIEREQAKQTYRMDTREKIVGRESVEALLASGEWTVVTGLFDPLTLTQARRLAKAADGGRKILAAVISDANTLLPAQARAELVAGLRSVDAVVIANPEQIRMPGVHIEEDAAAERERSADFVRFVLRRQESTEIPA